jgi:hypothetical protein
MEKKEENEELLKDSFNKEDFLQKKVSQQDEKYVTTNEKKNIDKIEEKDISNKCEEEYHNNNFYNLFDEKNQEKNFQAEQKIVSEEKLNKKIYELNENCDIEKAKEENNKNKKKKGGKNEQTQFSEKNESQEIKEEIEKYDLSSNIIEETPEKYKKMHLNGLVKSLNNDNLNFQYDSLKKENNDQKIPVNEIEFLTKQLEEKKFFLTTKRSRK